MNFKELTTWIWGCLLVVAGGMLICYPLSMGWILFPFDVSGDLNNECYTIYSNHLTNRTDDPLYHIEDKCCSITNQVEYPKLTFSCVDMID